MSWLYFRFPLSLRMIEEMLAARGICVTFGTVRQWGKKFGKAFADQIRRRAPARGKSSSETSGAAVMSPYTHSACATNP